MNENSFVKPTDKTIKKSDSLLENLKQIERIKNSPTYKMADSDKNFIASSDAKSIRFQLDYLKAELALCRLDIHKTIVVFGSSRIIEKKSALEDLEHAKKVLEKNPESKTLLQKVKIAKNVLENSKYYDMTREFAQLVALAGKNHKILVATGGGPGIMEAANLGAFEVGAKSIGYNISFAHEQSPNPYITPELCFQFHYFSTRKMHFAKRACGILVAPGGYGTLDELFEILMLVQTKKMPPLPIVLLDEEFWRDLINFDKLMMDGVVEPEDNRLFKFANSAKEAWDYMKEWHIENKTALF